MRKIRHVVRNALYFLKGHDAERFGGPSFIVRKPEDFRGLEKFGTSFKLIVPTSKCRWAAGFCLSSQTHPFVATMKAGNISKLENFYGNYKPRNVWEMYFLAMGKNSQLMSLPWKRVKFKADCIESDGLVSSAGHQWFGPVSREKVALEYKRCMTCFQSIRDEGYFPKRYGGFPRGHFLLNESDFCFQVDGGQHRLAALAALELNDIEVMCVSGSLTLVQANQVADWPAVKEGHIGESDAVEMFDVHMSDRNSEKHKALLSM